MVLRISVAYVGSLLIMGLVFFVREPAPGDSAFFVLPVFFVICMYALQIKRIFKQQRDVWSSFELVITPVSVLRRQKGFRDIEVSREKIRGVMQHRTGGMTILGSSIHESIFVPVGLDGYEGGDALASMGRADFHGRENLSVSGFRRRNSHGAGARGETMDP